MHNFGQQPQDVESEVVNDGAMQANVPNVRLNLGTTLQSPFFWLLCGMGLGLWLGWGKGSSQAKQAQPMWW